MVAAVPNSLLFLGRPGVGKTTVIREMARVLSDELHKRVVIVDTSNEIGGDGDVPHPAIGGARRMQVPDPSQQHKVMVPLMHLLVPLQRFSLFHLSYACTVFEFPVQSAIGQHSTMSRVFRVSLLISGGLRRSIQQDNGLE